MTGATLSWSQSGREQDRIEMRSDGGEGDSIRKVLEGRNKREDCLVMLSQCLFQLFPLPLRFDIQARDLLTIASRLFILGSIDDNIRSTVSIEFVVGAQSYLHL